MHPILYVATVVGILFVAFAGAAAQTDGFVVMLGPHSSRSPLAAWVRTTMLTRRKVEQYDARSGS